MHLNTSIDIKVLGMNIHMTKRNKYQIQAQIVIRTTIIRISVQKCGLTQIDISENRLAIQIDAQSMRANKKTERIKKKFEF